MQLFHIFKTVQLTLDIEFGLTGNFSGWVGSHCPDGVTAVFHLQVGEDQ